MTSALPLSLSTHLKTSGKTPTSPVRMYTSLRVSTALAFVMLSATGAQAANFTILNGTTEQTTQTLSAGENGVIEKGATLDVSNPPNASAAKGVSLDGVGAKVVNNGDIIAKWGPGFYTDVSATDAVLINNGSIRSSATLRTPVQLRGQNNLMTNNGVIESTAGGIHALTDATNSTIINNGTILANDGNSGIALGAENATATNNGSIIVNGNNGKGVSISSSNHFHNTGLIRVTGDNAIGINFSHGIAQDASATIGGTVIALGSNAKAIEFKAGDVVTIKPGATIIGAIDMNGRTDNVLNIEAEKGARSMALTVIDPGTINLPSDNKSIVLKAGNTILTVDPTALSAKQNSLATTTKGIHRTVTQQLARSKKSRPVLVASAELEPGMLPTQKKSFAWGQFFGEYNKRGDNGGLLAHRSKTGGVVAGYETPLDNHSIGFFGGGAFSQMETDITSVDSEVKGAFVGGYGQYVLGKWAFDAALIAGYQRHHDKRFVVDNLAGEETALSDYNSLYISPSIGLTRTIDIRHGVQLLPSASLNYTYGYYGAYDETGTTSSNLSVKGHGADAINGRVQLSLKQQLSNGQSELEMRTGAKYSYFGREGVDIGLANEASSYTRYQTGGDPSTIGGYIGGNFRYELDDKITLVGDIETGFARNDEKSVGGYIGLEYKF
ncbi:autotransporter domain-containing protein [Terasakiella pusilla]|uniref:autotransporter family protein n=1 Tax=Terasakiella pusilla TaxID=64973 RepID=UPI003AA90BA6